MTDDDIKAIAKLVVKTMKEDESAFFVARKRHFLDHEMLKTCREQSAEMRLNHEFVSSVRQGSGIAKKATIVVAVGAFMSFFGAAVWHYLGESLKQIIIK